MRVTGGQLRGRVIRAPRGSHTRPTSERVREALFSILGPPPDNGRVLDLFAGSGALGIESLSRGAASAVFVEQAGNVHRNLKQTLHELDLEAQSVVVRANVLSWIPMCETRTPNHSSSTFGPFHWVFADPPYQGDLADRTLALVAKSGLLTSDGILILEHDRRNSLETKHDSLVRTDQRSYGDTRLSFYTKP